MTVRIDKGSHMTTKANADCRTALCQYDSVPRTKFFNGMLLSDEHLRAEQLYHREALKRINRYMWGAGIVCGLQVETVGFCIKVHPGFALDCEGNAIEMCRCVTIDMADLCKERFPGGCVPQGAEEITKCLRIRYTEIDDGSVMMTTPGDDCSGATGKPRPQASRVREGFCLEFADACPDGSCRDDDDGLITFFKRIVQSGQAGPRTNELDECMRRTPVCPTCECDDNDCGICLAKLVINCDKRSVTIEGACRRYVWTASLLRKLALPAVTGPAGQSEAERQELERMRRNVARHEQPPPSPPTGRGRRGASRQTTSTSEDEGE
jgi:hypothetical protein